MLQKKDGKINKIIYDNTVYNDGKYHWYLPVPSLYRVLDLIMQTNETTEYLKLTPFYVNGILNRQKEFEEMMFYLECRNNVSITEKNAFLIDCCDEGETINDDILTRFCLCEYSDVKGFQAAILRYKEYLEILIPKITNILINDYDIGVDKLLGGYICFEICSN